MTSAAARQERVAALRPLQTESLSVQPQLQGRLRCPPLKPPFSPTPAARQAAKYQQGPGSAGATAGQGSKLQRRGKATAAAAEVADLRTEAFLGLNKNSVGPDALSIPWRQIVHLNRYTDVVPNPRTRVQLQEEGGGSSRSQQLGGGGYINANYIHSFDGLSRSYIATQGPMKTTIEHFWRMVWQHGSTIVVMLTGLTEGGIQKCDRYWPGECGPSGSLVCESLTVTLVSSQEVGAYVHSVLEVCKHGEESLGSNCRSRRVEHFWYRSWPDHGVPEDPQGVLDMLREVRLSFTAQGGGKERKPPPPWVVHCSAGLGRTGTLILVDAGVQQLRSTGRADVVALVQRLREDRGGLVQTAEQVAFAHRALLLEAAAGVKKRRGPPLPGSESS